MNLSSVLILGFLALSPGNIPPEISAQDLNNNPVSLDDYKGKVLLVDFWATWCIPCRKSIPIYSRMYRELKSEGFEVLAISVDEERSNVDAFAKKNGLAFRIVHDAKGEIAEAYEPPKMPTSYLIAPDGKLVSIYEGFNQSIHESFEAKVDALLKALKEVKQARKETEDATEKKVPESSPTEKPEPAEPPSDEPAPEKTEPAPEKEGTDKKK